MLGLTSFGDIYRDRRVILTGHTGFKGSWMALWLTELGANLTGISLSPETNLNHWEQLGLSMEDRRIDVRNLNELRRVFETAQPEVVFHLAAQPLVRQSYRDPISTWQTNVIGTANILESCRDQPSVKAIVVVTTDKCYENQNWPWGYRENDRLGGHDPYSASKAATEYVASSYRSSFFCLDSSPLLATARAGNVIGGGDWSQDRLIPDVIRAVAKNTSLEVRAPQATRPWQHVLESLSGYLLLGQKLLSGDKSFADAWNFGPEREGNRTVSEVLTNLKVRWGSLRWHVTEQQQPHEATLLYLDNAKARSKLGWQPVWDLDITLEKTAEWYRAWLADKAIISRRHLADYLQAAADSKIEWARK